MLFRLASRGTAAVSPRVPLLSCSDSCASWVQELHLLEEPTISQSDPAASIHLYVVLAITECLNHQSGSVPACIGLGPCWFCMSTTSPTLSGSKHLVSVTFACSCAWPRSRKSRSFPHSGLAWDGVGRPSLSGRPNIICAGLSRVTLHGQECYGTAAAPVLPDLC